MTIYGDTQRARTSADSAWKLKLFQFEQEVRTDVVNYPATRARSQLLRRIHHVYGAIRAMEQAVGDRRVLDYAVGDYAKNLRSEYRQACFETMTDGGRATAVVRNTAMTDEAFNYVGISCVADGSPDFPAFVVDAARTMPEYFVARVDGRETSYRLLCEQMGKIAYFVYESDSRHPALSPELEAMANEAWITLNQVISDYQIVRLIGEVSDRSPSQDVWESARDDLAANVALDRGVPF